MFEKEAEEYRESITQRLFNEDDVEGAWQRGAEFGYNKANEWHYVKDGDLPKEYDTVLACTEFEQHKSCLICNYHYQKWWYADGKYDEDVIAWKEIKLPELKESE